MTDTSPDPAWEAARHAKDGFDAYDDLYNPGWREPKVARLFRLERDVDQTGVSGIGIVADGVVWPDGTVALRWRGVHASTVCWTRLEDAEAVHGHGGATRFVFGDDNA